MDFKMNIGNLKLNHDTSSVRSESIVSFRNSERKINRGATLKHPPFSKDSAVGMKLEEQKNLRDSNSSSHDGDFDSYEQQQQENNNLNINEEKPKS
jgi:hypothetical protein